MNILFEYAPDGFYLSDLKGTLLDGNKAAQELIGYKKEELVGKNFLKLGLLSPKQIPKAASLLAKNALGLSTGPDEFILYRKDGTQVTVEIRTFPIKFKGNNIVLGIARDITERKHVEEELINSVRKFRELSELLPQIVFEIDSEGLVTYCNHTGLETFGYTHKDIEKGISASDFFIPEERERLAQNIQKRLTRIEFYDHEYTALRKNGSTLPVYIYSAPIFSDNKPVGIRGVLIDITDQKLTEERLRKAQEELELKVHERTAELQKLNEALLSDIAKRKEIEEAMRESEQKYRSLFEESKDVIYMSTPQGKFTDINPAGVDLLGYTSKDELFQIDITHDLYVYPSARKTFQKTLAQKGYVKDFEVEFKRKDGDHVVVLLTSTAVRDKDGKITAYRGIMKDITDWKHLEQQLLQAQKMEAIGQLAGGVAHDFNNILTAIIGYGNLLKTEVSKNELLSTYVIHILNSAERASNLTHNLLAFSRRQMINPKPVNVNSILNGLKTFLPRLIGEDIVLSIRLTKKDLTVIADSSQIEQVLMNLATTARDAMPDGGKLTITTDQVELGSDFIMAHGYGTIGAVKLVPIHSFLFRTQVKEWIERQKKDSLIHFLRQKKWGKAQGLVSQWFTE